MVKNICFQSSSNPLCIWANGNLHHTSFGSVMENRYFQADNLGYRFSMNGQEKDDEIYGKGNTTSAEFWEYDARLCRRWNLDPKPHSLESQYSCFLGNPIVNTDKNGQFVIKGSTKGEDKSQRQQNRLEKKALRQIVREMRREMRTWTSEDWAQIKENTGLDKRQYKQMFKPGKGPELSFSNIKVRSSGLTNGDNNGNTTIDDSYAQCSNDGNKISITLDEGFFHVYRDLNKSERRGIGIGVLSHAQKRFGSGLLTGVTNEKSYLRSEKNMYLLFAVQTFSHEVAHAGAFIGGRPNSLPTPRLGTTERGEYHELYFYGFVRDHSDFGYSIYRTFEERSFTPSLLRPADNTPLENRKTNFWNATYGL